MPTLKIKQNNIKAFVYEGDGKRDVRWDAALPGFGVRVYPSGEKAFLISYRVRNRKRMMVLGTFGKMTLEQARTRARKLFVQVEDGLDPLEEKRTAGKGRTLGDLIDDFMTKHVEKQGLKTGHAIKMRLERNIPSAWLSRHADAIAGWEIEDLHSRIGETRRYEANRFLEILRKMYRLAPRWGYLDPSIPNPTDGIEKFTEHKRKRWVKPEELPALAQAIDQERNVYIRAVLWLYLLTGMRKSELLAARREDVDWGRGRLRLPHTKAGEEQYATLSGPAMGILQAIPPLPDNPYLFPGARPGQHLVNISKAWLRIRKAADVEDVRLHDLRRTTGSWMTQAGVDLNVIKDALRHANLSTTLTYARLGEDVAREPMEEHGRRILEAAGRRFPAEVLGPVGKGT
jgi:integrase